MRAAVSDYVRYLDAVSAAAPAPPRPWGTLNPRPADNAIAVRCFRAVLQAAWYSAVAATLVSRCFFFWPSRVLTAAELLHQAKIRAKAAEAPRAIRIRTRTAHSPEPFATAFDMFP